jgi:hypothetical protein
LFGAAVSRGEALVVRLALIYALLDKSPAITAPHVFAALAIWERAEASAWHVFGDSSGNPLADELLQALRRAGPAGMARTAIHGLFGRHRSSDRIQAALRFLQRQDKVEPRQVETGGRPSEIWVALTGDAQKAQKAQKA